MRLLSGFALPVILICALSACGSSEASSDQDAPPPSALSADEGSSADEPEFDEDKAREDAEQEVADEGYDGPCTVDCSGHDAGFEWAADGHEDGGGVSRSPSFDEGQETYEEGVEERVEEKRREFEDDGEDSDYAM